MRAVVQRVISSSLSIDGKVYSEINKGFMVLVGITNGDTEKDIRAMAEKIIKLRVFEDENGKMNLSLNDVGGELQLVSQFTLYANCKEGNRPAFIDAARPEVAIPLYEKFIEDCKELTTNKVVTGVFGADMKINLVNDGPVTIMLEIKDGKVL